MKFGQIIWMVCLLGLVLAASLPSQAQGDRSDSLVLRYFVEEPVIEAPEKGLEDLGDAYRTVSIPGLERRVVPGEPILPVKTARILIPQGEEVETVVVAASKERDLGQVLIEPGWNVYPADYLKNNMSEPEPFILNEAVYGSMTHYPEDIYSILGIQEKNGYKILYVDLYPIRYIPKTRDASYFETFEIKVKTAPTRTLDQGFFRGLPEDRDLVERMVDNPSGILTYERTFMITERSALLDGTYDYIIITNEDMKKAPGPYNFQALARWKEQKGLSVAIVTVEEIEAAYKYSGIDTAERIRNFIKDAHQNNGLIYVLLGGDGDGAVVGGETKDMIVPGRGLWSKNYEPDYYSCSSSSPNVISDLYYACLDGNYDYDSDGVFGEPNDGVDGKKVDLLSEVYVGRAPVDNYVELNNFVRKTLAYESESPDDPYLTSALMVGEYLGDYIEADRAEYWGGAYGDTVARHFPEGFYIRTFYDRTYRGDDCGFGYQNWPKYELIDRINDNLHIINHIGSANFCDIVAYAMKMGYNDADALKNDKYFFGYSQAGYAGSFDNRDPEGIYLPHDCVLEHFVTAKGGAFAFVGNSRFGLLGPNPSSSPSQKFCEAFWETMFQDSVMSIGQVNQESKELYVSSALRDTNMRYCYYDINLLGDPETKLHLPSLKGGMDDDDSDSNESKDDDSGADESKDDDSGADESRDDDSGADESRDDDSGADESRDDDSGADESKGQNNTRRGENCAEFDFGQFDDLRSQMEKEFKEKFR